MADAKESGEVDESLNKDEETNEDQSNSGTIASSTTEASNSTPNETNLLGGHVVENPFSFRHFLRRPQNVSASAQHKKLDEEFEANRFGGARPKTRGKPKDVNVKSPCGLPDFVQDHLLLDQELQQESSYHNRDNDFRNQTPGENNPLDLPRSHSPIHAAGAMPIPLDLANLATLSIEEDIHLGTLDLANLNASSLGQPDEPVPVPASAHEINNNENVNSLSQLPDFLSDGAMQTGRINSEHMEPSCNLPGPQNNVDIEENVQLRHQLESSQVNERITLARIELLESHLEEYRRRDSNETSTLAKAMEQIENNLKSAMERALSSENQVVQLKKENRILQDEIKKLQAALRLQQSEAGPAGCSSRGLTHTAQELHTAANRAERSIRDLLAGVEHLRVMATSLDGMDRIEELRPKRDKEK